MSWSVNHVPDSPDQIVDMMNQIQIAQQQADVKTVDVFCRLALCVFLFYRVREIACCLSSFKATESIDVGGVFCACAISIIVEMFKTCRADG